MQQLIFSIAGFEEPTVPRANPENIFIYFGERYMEIDYFDQHRIQYYFEFDVKGKRYRYIGEKTNIKPWNLLYTHTTCFGTLVEVTSGKLVSSSVTYFKAYMIPKFLTSFRII